MTPLSLCESVCLAEKKKKKRRRKKEKWMSFQKVIWWICSRTVSSSEKLHSDSYLCICASHFSLWVLKKAIVSLLDFLAKILTQYIIIALELCNIENLNRVCIVAKILFSRVRKNAIPRFSREMSSWEEFFRMHGETSELTSIDY